MHACDHMRQVRQQGAHGSVSRVSTVFQLCSITPNRRPCQLGCTTYMHASPLEKRRFELLGINLIRLR
jgi:hypothetical protein